MFSCCSRRKTVTASLPRFSRQWSVGARPLVKLFSPIHGAHGARRPKLTFNNTYCNSSSVVAVGNNDWLSPEFSFSRYSQLYIFQVHVLHTVECVWKTNRFNDTLCHYSVHNAELLHAGGQEAEAQGRCFGKSIHKHVYELKSKL